MKIYVCGPTVYSEVHIGNMRPILVFDTIANAYKQKDIKVQFIHNITDIDDKIIFAAKENNLTEKQISTKYFNHYKTVLKSFNVNTITDMPKVTDYMEMIKEYISNLIKNGNAYFSEGNVWFDVYSDPKYGSISNRKLNKNSLEKNNEDFALWKKTDLGIKFDSPWGKGRPGWHTECAVFIEKLAKNQLDIHGGGIDLLFPHNENEATQFRVLNKKEITKKWAHVGHLNFEGIKMSKSLGNIIKASDFLKKYDGDILRLIFLNSSFSAPLSINDELIKSTVKKYENIKKIYLKAKLLNLKKPDKKEIIKFSDLIINFKFSDFSFQLNKIIKSLNKTFNEKEASLFLGLISLINLNLTNLKITKKIIEIFNDYNIAKSNQEYKKSDKLRIELKKMGII